MKMSQRSFDRSEEHDSLTSKHSFNKENTHDQPTSDNRCPNKSWSKYLSNSNNDSKLKKINIEEKLEEYSSSFTIHGLSRSIKAKNIESIFWSTTIIIGLICACMLIHTLVKKFNSRAVYSEIRFQITDKNFFPSITFCERHLLIDSYFSYCGIAASQQHKVFSKHMPFPGSNKPCTFNFTETTPKIKEGSNGEYWATNMFNVTYCQTLSGKRCATSKMLRSAVHLNNSCITWNYDGNIYDMYSHVDIRFQFKPPPQLRGRRPKIIALIHDPAIREIDITRKVDIFPNKHYDIQLDKTIIKRLPEPYPANCSDQKMGDIFPGKYSRYACIESYNFIKMYQRCGDTLDYVRDHIPKYVRDNYARQQSVIDTLRCFREHLSAQIKTVDSCRFPCEVLDLNVVTSVHDQQPRHGSTHAYARNGVSNESYDLGVHFARVDTYRTMTEKPLYTWDQMACEVGGFIGLVMGLSVISVIEVVAYIVLKAARHFV